jgi:hypothetical protein
MSCTKGNKTLTHMCSSTLISSETFIRKSFISSPDPVAEAFQPRRKVIIGWWGNFRVGGGMALMLDHVRSLVAEKDLLSSGIVLGDLFFVISVGVFLPFVFPKQHDCNGNLGIGLQLVG